MANHLDDEIASKKEQIGNNQTTNQIRRGLKIVDDMMRISNWKK